MSAGLPSTRRTWRFVHVLMTMAVGAALGACFNPPADAVLFACDPEAAPTCPDGYTCEVDGCCHRDGSDIDATLGSCRIGGGMSGASAASDSDASASSGASTSSGASDSSGASGAVTSSTASSGPSDSSGTSGSTGADTGSSDASAT
jgi:hypothetical protein